MSIETVADAIVAAKTLYPGRDAHLHVKPEWWSQQLGPPNPLRQSPLMT